MTITQYLTSLGSTSQEVAQSLRQQGIKGLKRSPCHCPILNAIYGALPHYWAGLHIVGGGQLDGQKVPYRASLNDAQIMDPQLTAAVQDFLYDFDNGLYPDLVAQKVVERTVRTWE
jgi:hypothetical protein